MAKTGFWNLLAGCLLAWSVTGRADTVIDYRVEAGDRTAAQPVIIRGNSLLVKSAGGDPNLDILYERAPEQLVLIDHGQRQFTPVTEARVRQLASQFEDVQPLLRGLAKQIAHLPPKQRAKWNTMLGGISLEQYTAARDAGKATTLRKAGETRTVAGVSCAPLSLLKNGVETAEFCLAEPAALHLAGGDAATLDAMLGFARKLAERAEGLAAPFGFTFEGARLRDLAGVPVEVREHGGREPLSLTLRQVGGEDATAGPLAIPAGYKARQLNFW